MSISKRFAALLYAGIIVAVSVSGDTIQDHYNAEYANAKTSNSPTAEFQPQPSHSHLQVYDQAYVKQNSVPRAPTQYGSPFTPSPPYAIFPLKPAKRFDIFDGSGSPSYMPPVFSWFPWWSPHSYFNLCPYVQPGLDPVWSYGCAPAPYPFSAQLYPNGLSGTAQTATMAGLGETDRDSHSFPLSISSNYIQMSSETPSSGGSPFYNYGGGTVISNGFVNNGNYEGITVSSTYGNPPSRISGYPFRRIKTRNSNIKGQSTGPKYSNS